MVDICYCLLLIVTLSWPRIKLYTRYNSINNSGALLLDCLLEIKTKNLTSAAVVGLPRLRVSSFLKKRPQPTDDTLGNVYPLHFDLPRLMPALRRTSARIIFSKVKCCRFIVKHNIFNVTSSTSTMDWIKSNNSKEHKNWIFNLYCIY